MRRARFKPEGIPVVYHLYNRVAGTPDFFPFGPAEKEQFIRLLQKLQRFFTVRILAYQVMSNHFHLLVHAPSAPPPPEEVASRYRAYYRGLRTVAPTDPRCIELGERMRDISWFMHSLQQQFSTWYNHTRPSRRRGTLWAERFKHTLLGGPDAVWTCWKYIEMNPVRAGMVQDPADYRFSSYSAWRGKGRHPFEANIQEIMVPVLHDFHPITNARQLLEVLQRSLDEECAVTTNGCNTRHTIQVERRARYWVDGLVIGSDIFVLDMIRQSRGILRLKKRACSRLRQLSAVASPLYVYKELRAV